MKSLKKTTTSLPHTGIALPFVLLTVGLLSGCQHEPITIKVLEFPPRIGFPPDTVDVSLNTVDVLPDTIGESQPKLSDIATHEFAIAKDRSIVGGLAVISANDGDTLPDIARHFGLGYDEITLANPGIGPWTPEAGARVLLPLQFILPDTSRKGIVLNLANMRMFYYPRNSRTPCLPIRSASTR